MIDTERRWRLFVNGAEKLPEDLPLTMQEGDILALQDGPIYVGIRPIAATALGRPDAARIVVALGGYGGTPEAGSGRLEPTITVANMHRVASAPIRRAEYDARELGRSAHGGFVVEFGDTERFADAVAFHRHLTAGSLRVATAGSDRVAVSYTSGADRLEAEFSTDVQELPQHLPIVPGTQSLAIARRTLNGTAILPPDGLERDTGWSQQGTTGRLEKNGAVLETEPGRKAYLVAEPGGRGVLAYNLTPDPTDWRLTLPGGREIRAQVKVGLLRVEVDEGRKIVTVDHERAHGAAPLAQRFVLTGFDAAWTIKAAAGTTERQ
jgi:hypothetical protein